ncbi:MAG: zinc ribbon domain-containing protein [Clostridia bacterium]|nr:zinc ribbon domain-containing protein [Clostridia bacterium]
MRCKNCGAPLDLNTRFCPNCGSQNEQAIKHISDMEKYGRQFNQTRHQVVSNSKWFVKYITPLTTLAISAIILALAWTLNGMDIGYDISRNHIKSYNKSHSEEIAANMKNLIDNNQYQAAYQAHNYLEWNIVPYGDRSWDAFYSVQWRYNDLRKSITAAFDPAMSDTYNAEEAISKAAADIEEIERQLQRLGSSYSQTSEESLECINSIEKEMHLFLKAYCNFTDEDIAVLPDMDKTSIITLLAKRMD